MQFESDGDRYRIVFTHKLVPKWINLTILKQPTITEVKRSETTATLLKRGKLLEVIPAVYSLDKTIPKREVYEWVEVGHATCRHHYKDKESRELARKIALRYLTHSIDEKLREKMWSCYLKRKSND